MDRYTYKRHAKKISYNIRNIHNLNNYNKAIDKLGRIEDIEQQLGIGIVELFGLVGKEVYYFTKTKNRKAKIIGIDFYRNRISLELEYFVEVGKHPRFEGDEGYYKRKRIGLFNDNDRYGWAMTLEDAQAKLGGK